MKRAGFLLLLAGWGVVIVAIAILSSMAMRYVFVIAGLLVEVLGLVLAGRNLRHVTGERE
jgi:hypothetical protein